MKSAETKSKYLKKFIFDNGPYALMIFAVIVMIWSIFFTPSYKKTVSDSEYKQAIKWANLNPKLKRDFLTYMEDGILVKKEYKRLQGAYYISKVK